MEATKDQIELLDILTATENEYRYNKIKSMFPDTGPYRRELYSAHMRIIEATATHSQLAFVGANRTGKTRLGAFIMACHLTGNYPHWWKGRKFKNAVNAWASGKTAQKTKEIMQFELLGADTDYGSGMIPKDALETKKDGSLKIIKRHGVTDSVETLFVKHVSGGISTLTFKSYEMGRDGFEGTKQQVIWLDEEPKDPSIYSECAMRLTDDQRPGILICTFTPLYGQSDVVLQFLPHGKFPVEGTHPDFPDRFALQITWDDVPHLSDTEKKKLWDSCLPHERTARSKGIPSRGAGAIYPYDEDDFLIEPIFIPPWWPRAYGMDVGWKMTAAVFGALDPDTNTLYLYSEYYSGREVPAIHASGIKARGDWLIGACDPDGVNQADGTHMFDLYCGEGLNLVKADKRSVEAALFKACQMFEAGQIKVFNTLTNWLNEFRSYNRDESGKIVKKNDHLMDAFRYLVFTGLEYVTLPPNSEYNNDAADESSPTNRDSHTGY